MKKSHKFNELSDVKCKCGKPLKARIVATKQPSNAHKCYKCYSNLRYATLRTPKLDATDKVTVNRECVMSHRDAL